MKVSLFQQDLVWGDVGCNLKCSDVLLRQAPQSDLYIFPEMFTTGFATPDDALTETEPSEGLAWMRKASAASGGAVCGSIALRPENGRKCVNRMFFVTPDGEYRVYDKRHLFSYGGEGRHYMPGTERVVVDYCGVRFLLAVCFDLRFPVWLRNRRDYDVLVVAANWPDARRAAWETLIRARAIENQCYVLAVNRTGRDPGSTYSGGTCVIGPGGNLIASVPDGEQGCCTAELDVEILTKFRGSFPVLDSADDFVLL